MRTKNAIIFAAALVTALSASLAGCASTTSTNDRGDELTLYAPVDQTLRRGETNSVTVRVGRDGFKGPVALEIEQLPSGLEVVEEEPMIGPDSNFGEFTLYARPDAELVTGHPVRVVAHGGDGLDAEQWFQVVVKAD